MSKDQNQNLYLVALKKSAGSDGINFFKSHDENRYFIKSTKIKKFHTYTILKLFGLFYPGFLITKIQHFHPLQRHLSAYYQHQQVTLLLVIQWFTFRASWQCHGIDGSALDKNKINNLTGRDFSLKPPVIGIVIFLYFHSLSGCRQR